jgi:DNA repair exonuclease SbcCD nuclease subunit
MEKILLIGDPHFRVKNYQEGEDLIERCVEIAEEIEPSNIIIMGDILDTHELARNGPFKQATAFIDRLSDIAPVYCIMGNHDYINQSQFLTDNHFFGPLKKWPNVTIVDYPIVRVLGDVSIVLCPYVPPGQFEKALDLTSDVDGHQYDWRSLANAIFAHQEIRGVIYGGKESKKGDVWKSDYPNLYCGHIHNSCQLTKNVLYTGSSVQVAIDENPDKKLWLLTFGSKATKAKPIELGLKGRKEIELAIEDLPDFDFMLTERYYIKVKIKGTSEQFKAFRKSKLHAKFIRKGVKISFDPIKEGGNKIYGHLDGETQGGNFDQILEVLVRQKSENIQRAYALLNETEVEFIDA